MPKPIKKKIVKKASAEDEVRNTYEKVVAYYEGNSKNINFALVIAAIVIIAVVLMYTSVQKSSRSSSLLRSQAYRAYIDAVTQNDTGVYEKAFEMIDKANESSSSAMLVYYESDLYEKQGEVDKAIEKLESLIKEFGSDELMSPLGYAKLGMLYRKKGDYENASNALDALGKSGYPVLRDFALYHQSGIQKKMGNAEEADRINDMLIEQFPRSPYAKEVEASMKAREEAEKKKAEKEEEESKKKEK